jgi:hypothetical protein
MFAAPRQYGTCPRPARAMIAVFAMALYLLSGTLHAACHLDVRTPSEETIVALVSDDTTGHSDQADDADHHCHGCFSVSIPAPPSASAAAEPVSIRLPQRETSASDRTPSLDPPPPKTLT